MLLRQMRYFTTVVDCNSFTEAAERFYISQSAVSQQIQALEQELGTKLIRRANRKFTLTAAGEYFYAQATAILEQVDKVVQETRQRGANGEQRLRIGYLRCYSGLELHQAVANFSQAYPDVAIDIVNGTHEELYDLLRFGGADLILSDQRRAFSDAYVNYELIKCSCCAELSVLNPLSTKEQIKIADLKGIPCILIAPREQQHAEQEYYQNTLGFGGSYLFADNLEEGRMLVVSGRGFLPVEDVGTLPPTGTAIRRLPVYCGENPLQRNYCLFWKEGQTNPYIEKFADIMYQLLNSKE